MEIQRRMAWGQGRERICYADFGKPGFFCHTILLARVFTLSCLLNFSELAKHLIIYMLIMGKQFRDDYIGQIGLHGIYVAGYASVKATTTEEKNECGKCTYSLQAHGF